MDQTIKAEWLAALRSGEYPKAVGRLRRLEPGPAKHPVGFCCLGVLCDLAARAGIGEWDRIRFESEGSEPKTTDLADVVQEWAGLSSADPEIMFEDERGEVRLSVLNDAFGWDFNKIADVIEQQL
ncbi:MAG: hypothetical protein LC723_07460 [Actinobacteria bacterium]|nr:hypothetical protein [Actinomycetota bacterium]